jgi:hypothetical protein
VALDGRRKDGGEVRVDLREVQGKFKAEWTDPIEGTITTVDVSRAKATLPSPLTGAAVLYLRQLQ